MFKNNELRQVSSVAMQGQTYICISSLNLAENGLLYVLVVGMKLIYFILIFFIEPSCMSLINSILVVDSPLLS